MKTSTVCQSCSLVRSLAFGLLLLAPAGCGSGGSGSPTSPGGPSAPAVGPPASIGVASAPSGTREAVVGGVLADPLVIQVRDSGGRGVPDVLVEIEVVSGGGWITAPSTRTNAFGNAEFGWYAGPTPDLLSGQGQRVRVRVGSLVTEATGTARAGRSGEVALGHRGFVEYIPGTLPLILTAPHGGTLLPSDLPDRTGNVTTVRDMATDSLARLMADSIEAQTGARPHLIRVHLHRRKLDANREIVEAAQGNPVAERAWREFHAFTEAAVAAVLAGHDRGFYIDLHGHGHEIQRLELGTLLSAADLNLPLGSLETTPFTTRSSLRGLIGQGGWTHEMLLRGPQSFGALWEAEGYPSVPSPTDPSPGSNPFFSGGYNTVRYGCRGGGPICGLQIEANRIGVRDSPTNHQRFAGASARVLTEILSLHAGWRPALPDGDRGAPFPVTPPYRSP